MINKYEKMVYSLSKTLYSVVVEICFYVNKVATESMRKTSFWTKYVSHVKKV